MDHLSETNKFLGIFVTPKVNYWRLSYSVCKDIITTVYILKQMPKVSVKQH